jgi:hypothetical protein
MYKVRLGIKNILIPMSYEYSVNDIRYLIMYTLNKVDTQKDFCENLRVFSGLFIAIMAFKIFEPNKQFELEKGPLLCEQNHSSFYNSKSNKSCRKINRSESVL